jgi:Domain of unknown function (DUF4190)
MSYPPPPSGPNDPWATPSPGQPGSDPYPGADPYAQPTYGGPPAAYGQPARYAYPAYGAYGYPPATNGKATAALWTGVGSLVLTFCCGFPGLAGIVAVVLGVMAQGEIRRGAGQQTGGGMAIAGIVTGAIAFVLGLVIAVLVIVALSADPSPFEPTGRSAT